MNFAKNGTKSRYNVGLVKMVKVQLFFLLINLVLWIIFEENINWYSYGIYFMGAADLHPPKNTKMQVSKLHPPKIIKVQVSNLHSLDYLHSFL